MLCAPGPSSLLAVGLASAGISFSSLRERVETVEGTQLFRVQVNKVESNGFTLESSFK